MDRTKWFGDINWMRFPAKVETIIDLPLALLSIQFGRQPIWTTRMKLLVAMKIAL